MKDNKTVITGMGMINALGNTMEESFCKMIRGVSGVRPITLFDPTGLETKIAAQVDNSFLEKAKELIKKRERGKMTRLTQMALVAADEAVKDSGIDFDSCDRSRVAVILGIVTTAYSDAEKEQSESNSIVKSMPNAPSAWISIRYGLKGPNFNVSTACASSAYAIALGQQLIQSGFADVVITGGADSHIQKDYIKGFNQIMTLSVKNETPESACCPFSRNRDGFVMGEGAGIMILESEAHAKKRGARIYAEVGGCAITSDAGDITAPEADGVMMAKTMKLAMDQAGVNPADIDYINAHGTSTYLNDKYETMAIKSCFGSHADDLYVSSTKSMIGHTVGASGVIEGIVTVLTMDRSIITPTINYKEPDPELDLNYVPNVPIQKQVNMAISNSFGFGGHNASILYRKYEGE
ncbi:beta-ketoacyl-[acyl-carrier-protein] synthase family protein [Lacrimispora amygdalina]|uniref:Nodulation protein E n=1 Tax=Lacrimispora amygdalina TaxID=253257 RepID=A0A3E2NDK6_9FIRM|nr:beta-ketoacyl-[acyl-carrier-protein] synthase family protein [Clostridium indicum]RFZ79107.1 beta-ketoacyl-[acyl-carrier-protein] synthase family protein [Clostridium indicum]